MAVKLELYRIFRAVAETGNISRAARQLYISQSAVSHQLRILKQSKLVKFRREGKAVYYSLDDDHVRSMLSMGAEHVEE